MSTKPEVTGRAMGFATAQRVNRSLTAEVERKALVWMAERAPQWFTSDRLTMLGLAAQAGAGIGYALSRRHREALLVVVVCIALNWLGDSLDGTLARVRHRSRPRYGFYVDHVVDIFGAAMLMTGLAWSGLLHASIAAAMLVGFLLLSGESYLATYTLARFEMSQGQLGPTEIRILMVMGTLAALRNPWVMVLGRHILLWDLGGVIAAAAMFGLGAAAAVRHTAMLYRQEPLA